MKSVFFAEHRSADSSRFDSFYQILVKFLGTRSVRMLWIIEIFMECEASASL